jgi:hypothetical protein
MRCLNECEAKGRVEKIDIQSAKLTECLFFRYFSLQRRGMGAEQEM